MARTLILWFASGEDGRDYEGRIAGSPLVVVVLWSPLTKNYAVRFAGEERGRFKTTVEARDFAAEHVDVWLEEVRRRQGEDERRREELRREDESERKRLEGAINVFANNGIPARRLEGLFLGASAAERLAVKLEEREQLAERVRELEAKRDK